MLSSFLVCAYLKAKQTHKSPQKLRVCLATWKAIQPIIFPPPAALTRGVSWVGAMSVSHKANQKQRCLNNSWAAICGEEPQRAALPCHPCSATKRQLASHGVSASCETSEAIPVRSHAPGAIPSPGGARGGLCFTSALPST